MSADQDDPAAPVGRPPLLQLVATCALGTEVAVAQELRALKMHKVRQGRGHVRFLGSLEAGMRACLHLRSAMRVLWQLAEVPAHNADALYEGAASLEWDHHLDPRHTLAVEATGGNEQLRHTGFVAQKVKDAIVDVVRSRQGSRPNVDNRAPDVPVVVHIQKDVASICLDLAGQPLHRRGYRPPGIQAPLKETLAASLLLMAGYSPTRAFCDPMAGSGTLVIEAAWMAMNRAPGLGRGFAFERWPGFAGTLQGAWHRMKHQATQAVQTADLPPLLAGDWSSKVMDQLTTSLAAAGVAEHVRVERWDVRNVVLPDGGGLVVTNPPYAERMGQPLQIHGLYRGMAQAAKGWNAAGWDVHVLCGDEGFQNHAGRRSAAVTRVFNGALVCGFHHWPATEPEPASTHDAAAASRE